MVIAGCDIGDDGAQHIEGRAHADGLLKLHIGLNLVQRHMAGAFHHHLHIPGPGPLGQFPQSHQLLNLAHIAAIGQTAGTAGIPQGDGHIILPADLQDFIEILVEGIFLPRHAHPCEHQRAATGDNIHLSLVCPDLFHGLAGNSAVKGDKIHPVLGMEPNHVKKILRGQGGQIPLVMDDAVVHRHCADHSGALLNQLLTERLGVPVGGQIHNGFCSHLYRRHHLAHFYLIILAVLGDAQVYIDLSPQHRTHAVGLQAGVQPVGAYGHLPLGNQVPNLLRCAVFLFRHRLHLRRDHPLPGGVHLCCVISHIHGFLSPYASRANSPVRLKLCCMGPRPRPRSSMAPNAPER